MPFPSDGPEQKIVGSSAQPEVTTVFPCEINSKPC